MVIKNLLGVKRLGKYYFHFDHIHNWFALFQTPSFFYNTISAITHHCAATPTSSPSNPYRVIDTHISHPYPYSQPIHSGSISYCPSPNVDFKFTFCNSYLPVVALWLWDGAGRYHWRMGMAFICLGQLGNCRNVSHLALELGCRKRNNEDDMFKCRWCLVFRWVCTLSFVSGLLQSFIILF